MIEDAEQRGLLKPGGTIIEATAGNTGVGLALVAAVKGYRCIFVLPDKMSQDKINLLKAYGAEVVITPTSVPPDSPESYNGVADRLAREIPGRLPAQPVREPGQSRGPLPHHRPGDLGGHRRQGRRLRGRHGHRRHHLRHGAVPQGAESRASSWWAPTRRARSSPAIRPKSYKVEGIGEDFVPPTFNRQVVDEMVRVSDAESFSMARRLAREEGLLVGGSAGTAVAAAVKYARRLDPGKVIVVSCCRTPAATT